MENWVSTTYGQITSKIGSGATPTGGSNSYKEEGISLIRSQNVLDFQFSRNGLAFIDDDQANELKGVTVFENDSLLNITGDSVARACIVPSNVIPARVNQHVSIVRPIPEIADHRFVFYNLQFQKQELLSLAEMGATRKAITKSMIEELELLLPSLPEQEAIAEVLSSLDDKIDLLHKQNQKLEELAEILYRQWFIVEANPEGDEVFLSDVADHHKNNIKPFENPFQEYFHYSIPAFDDGQNPQIELGDTIRSNKYQVLTNSILISKLNPRFPRVWQISKPIDEEVSICSTEFQVVLPHEQRWFPFIYYFLKSRPVTDELIGAAGGTSGSHQRVSPDDIFNLSFIKPDDVRLNRFYQLTSPNLEKINNNREQILKLEKLRNTLLPKLMSGEVRVKM